MQAYVSWRKQGDISMIDWDHWRTILAVFRTGTYTGAARMLRLDATTVGRRVKSLEQRLGHRLFIRDGDRFYPTKECEPLLAHVEAAAEALRDAEQANPMPDHGAIWRDMRMTAPPFLISYLFAPVVGRLSARRRIRVELVGTASKAGLQRREADIALRIEDRPGEIRDHDPRIEAEQVGEIPYAVYRPASEPDDDLPWAGLMPRHVRTSGEEVMMNLAGEHGFRFRVQQFDALCEIVAGGAARAMLPRFIGERDERLAVASQVVLRQPLWMLYHQQDGAVPHLKYARAWIDEVVQEGL